MILMKIKNDTVSDAFITKFPDGQQNVTLDMNIYSPKSPMVIYARIKTWKDFELFYTATMAALSNDIIIDRIVFYYMLGQRCDRAFESGQCNYFRQVIARLLDSIPISNSRIYFFEAHNPSLIDFCGFSQTSFPYAALPIDTIRIGADANSGYDDHFKKVRDKDGKITSLEITNKIRYRIEGCTRDLPILIVDDLCDGGATFEKIGEILKSAYPEKKLWLFVAHGLFTKGFDALSQYYEKIYTTNSYRDFEQYPDLIKDEFLNIIEVI